MKKKIKGKFLKNKKSQMKSPRIKKINKRLKKIRNQNRNLNLNLGLEVAAGKTIRKNKKYKNQNQNLKIHPLLHHQEDENHLEKFLNK
jgi:hypothetical protein